MAYRNVQEEIWKSKAFRGVSKDAKLLLFYFMTGRDTNQSGICELDHEYAKFEAGLTDEEYKKSFQELEDQGLIIVDHENSEFSVTDWNFHNWKSNISNFTNACKHIAKSNSIVLIQHFLDTIPLQDRKAFFEPTGRDKNGMSFAGAFTHYTGYEVITTGDQLLFTHGTPEVDRRLSVGTTEAEAEAESKSEKESKSNSDEESGEGGVQGGKLTRPKELKGVNKNDNELL
ncbi:MAG: hypothetical protein QM216_06475, partial [Bacillota bacterium]|nr:hypothetical protein [Bacillota bacterium]